MSKSNSIAFMLFVLGTLGLTWVFNLFPPKPVDTSFDDHVRSMEDMLASETSDITHP